MIKLYNPKHFTSEEIQLIEAKGIRSTSMKPEELQRVHLMLYKEASTIPGRYHYCYEGQDEYPFCTSGDLETTLESFLEAYA